MKPAPRVTETDIRLEKRLRHLLQRTQAQGRPPPFTLASLPPALRA